MKLHDLNHKFMERRLVLITIFFLFLLVYYLLIHVYDDSTVWKFKPPKYKKDLNTRRVLVFTTFWGLRGWGFALQNARNHSKCPYKCEYTEDKGSLYEADAVVFHGLSLDLLRRKVKPMILKPRPPELWDQIWIFRLHESPLSYPDVRLLSYANIFNWTMTYRRDSDIYFPSGQFMLRNNSRRPIQFKKLKIDDKSLRKRKLVASMISNCNPRNGRLQYISLMKQYTVVDDYGRCGTLTCDKGADYFDCYKLFGRRYKFFLAFENSICADYVTEKAFHPLRTGMVPIVRGGGNYSTILPKGSYINTQDFKSVLGLVNYLNYLDQNNTAYRKYFDWREIYEMNSWNLECDLCTKIHRFDLKRDRKSYPNISAWYHNNYTQHHLCINPQVPII